MRPPQIRLVLLLVSALLLLTVATNITSCQQAQAYRLEVGSSGLRVTALQWLLNAEQIDVSVTGSFAAQTVSAVRQLQVREQREATGGVDQATLRRLTPDTRAGDRGLHVRGVQSLLNLHGLSTGVYDDFDGATEASVLAFQKSAGLDRTGVVDRRTWDALFEGPNRGTAVSEADQFVATIAPYAEDAWHRFGVPPSVAIAQAAQETGWGRSAPGNNYFGVKCHGGPSRSGPVAYDCLDHNTNEWEGDDQVAIVDSFRSYRSMHDSVNDYGNFLRTNARYAPAFSVNGDPNAFARVLQRSGYATDPAYADALIQIMDQRDLYRFNR